ncbi:MAG: type II secretion system protein [Nitrospirales bacterium]|nr:type II secretion system protein [Nitrospirales bacterium]
MVKTSERGITYLIVMFTIVLMGITLMMVGQQWSIVMKRDREAELLFRGNRIKEAIDRFVADYEVQKATRSNRYPQTLQDLTNKTPRRYLPVVYKDPITGEDFEVIKVGSDIRGVRSTSMEKPMDQVHFKGAINYQAVRFETSQQSTKQDPKKQTEQDTLDSNSKILPEAQTS